jgi:hypothetical protein
VHPAGRIPDGEVDLGKLGRSWEANLPNLLDDLFQWAAQEPAGNTVTVKLAIATNEITRDNLVSYAEGTLTYHPPRHAGILTLPANFASDPDGITQYFSDRRFGSPLPTNPFDPGKTDPLDVTIVAIPQYTATFHSSRWNFEFTVTLTFDAATEIIFAANGPTFLVLSLCSRNSVSTR